MEKWFHYLPFFRIDHHNVATAICGAEPSVSCGEVVEGFAANRIKVATVMIRYWLQSRRVPSDDMVTIFKAPDSLPIRSKAQIRSSCVAWGLARLGSVIRMTLGATRVVPARYPLGKSPTIDPPAPFVGHEPTAKGDDHWVGNAGLAVAIDSDR
jgi:hypothetical protein